MSLVSARGKKCVKLEKKKIIKLAKRVWREFCQPVTFSVQKVLCPNCEITPCSSILYLLTINILGRTNFVMKIHMKYKKMKKNYPRNVILEYVL